jgi:hypothetical protein
MRAPTRESTRERMIRIMGLVLPTTYVAPVPGYATSRAENSIGFDSPSRHHGFFLSLSVCFYLRGAGSCFAGCGSGTVWAFLSLRLRPNEG